MAIQKDLAHTKLRHSMDDYEKVIATDHDRNNTLFINQQAEALIVRSNLRLCLWESSIIFRYIALIFVNIFENPSWCVS